MKPFKGEYKIVYVTALILFAVIIAGLMAEQLGVVLGNFFNN